MTNYYRGFTVTAHGLAFHYTWNERMKAYVNDENEDMTFKDVPKSTFRRSVVVDEWNDSDDYRGYSVGLDSIYDEHTNM